MLSPRLGFSDSGSPLTLTGRAHVTGALLLGIDDMAHSNDDGMWRYQIEVEHTNITEYYEYSERKSTEEVRQDWLSDVSEGWSEPVAEIFKGNITVIPLWDKQTSEDTEAIALPPKMSDSEE